MELNIFVLCNKWISETSKAKSKRTVLKNICILYVAQIYTPLFIREFDADQSWPFSIDFD
jgi:hypothetical protein